MFGLQPPGMSLPLGVYKKCTVCGSLRGWLIVMPKLVGGLGELMGRLEDEDTVVLCTKCSKGRISGLDPKYIEKMEPKVIPFWKYLKDEEFVIESLKIETREAMKDRGLTPYDCKVFINGEVVERLMTLELIVWIGEPGFNLKLVFGIHKFDDDGNLKEIEKKYCEIGKDRIRGLEFDLMKVDDHKKDDEKG